MNWENIHLVYYVYTSISVAFLLLALGKYFCVRRLYEVYNVLDRKLDYGLNVCLIIGFGILMVAYVSLFFVWKTMILLSVLAMMLCGGVFTIIVVCFVLGMGYDFLGSYHHKLKRKKNLY